MKKSYNFNSTDEFYIITEKDKTLFEIKKDSLDFDGNNFYNAFFKDINQSSGTLEIDLKNKLSVSKMNADKKSKAIYDIICEIFKEITTNINTELLEIQQKNRKK